ncbi:MBL fold metallo-hydrolase [Aciduricibacillus chroicocephali]|uniref:MBL fold metallo-hydrolase n=1 Tax=Aciduricibacillus chroicocephali TaxID=3054939 RepID=A0ABY9KRW2_9BACI|nr:MBL fold metallo-hydrolase [Bacillaceae bacterium 44XB]
MNIQGMSLGPLGANCYIVFKGKDAIIIDPGSDAQAIEHAIDQLDLTPQAILLTHAHFDHIGALDEIRKRYQTEVYIHEDEKDWLQDSGLNRSKLFSGEDIVTSPAEHYLYEGKMEIGPFSIEVLHTPGHSPGSVSFVFHEDEKVISGDALFFQGIGRTDLPGGDRDILENSIKSRLYQLPDTYTVYPGHGPNTTIGSEKQNNPFVYVR